jgi:hypothetical protein
MNLGYPYMVRAWELQRDVRSGEYEKASTEPLDYTTGAHLRMAIVHARQDLVLVVSLLTSLNGQVRVVRWLLCALLGVLLLFRFGL